MKRFIPVLLAFALLASGFCIRQDIRLRNSDPADSSASDAVEVTDLGRLPVLIVSDGTTETVYTLADANYEYQSTYMQFYQYYGSYGLISTSIPLNEQTCILDSEGGTWDDYFKNAAESNLIARAAIKNAASVAGYTELTEEEQAQINDFIESIAVYASYYGYDSVDGFLSQYYGYGNNENSVREILKEQLLGTRYLQDLYDGYTYTDEELDEYYSRNEEKWDRIGCLLGSFPAESEDDLAQAFENAEMIASDTRGDEKSFCLRVEEETGEAPFEAHDTVENFLKTFGDEVAREDISEGFTFVSRYSGAVTVCYIQGIEDNRYRTVNVRHILIMTKDADGNGEYSEEEKQAAYDAVKAIEEEWLSGEATEESFAALAAEKSEDGGSTAVGGLYEDIYKGQMVTGFNDFCFAGHERGDTGIVYGESSAYSGYHFIYFVGETEQLYSRLLAEDDLRSEEYSRAYDEIIAPYTAERTSNWEYVMNN